MKIRLLSSAMDDLYEGRLFYEKQGEGLGESVVVVWRVLDLRRNPRSIRRSLLDE